MMAEIEQKKQFELDIIKAEKTTKQNEFIFLKPIYAAEDMFDKVGRKTRETWMDRFSPDAIRRWVVVSPYMKPWMVLQVLVTILAIVNYVMLTYLVNKDQGKYQFNAS